MKRLHHRRTIFNLGRPVMGTTQNVKIPDISHRIKVRLKSYPAFPGLFLSLRT